MVVSKKDGFIADMSLNQTVAMTDTAGAVRYCTVCLDTDCSDRLSAIICYATKLA